MNDSYTKLETRTIELNKFRSNTDGISTAERSRRNNNKKKKEKKTKKKSSISTFCSIKTDKNNKCIDGSINIQNDRQTYTDIAKTPLQMNRYMVDDNCYSRRWGK